MRRETSSALVEPQPSTSTAPIVWLGLENDSKLVDMDNDHPDDYKEDLVRLSQSYERKWRLQQDLAISDYIF